MEKDPEKQEDRERKTETKKLASYDGFPVLLRQYGARRQDNRKGEKDLEKQGGRDRKREDRKQKDRRNRKTGTERQNRKTWTERQKQRDRRT
jgi:hypothetical protein